MAKKEASDVLLHCAKNEEILNGKLHFLCSVAKLIKLPGVQDKNKNASK